MMVVVMRKMIVIMIKVMSSVVTDAQTMIAISDSVITDAQIVLFYFIQ